MMFIHEIILQAANLPALREFYHDLLGLSIALETADQLSVQIGNSRLTFQHNNNGGRYHYAVNIPENQFQEAKTWLADRVPLIPDSSGVDEFFSESWNAHMTYFYDPTGNIGELIARHRLPNASTDPFGAAGWLTLSEIGVAVEEVNQTVDQFGLPRYGSGSDDFSAIGDENGLLIVVKTGRLWRPDDQVPAWHYPLTIHLEDQGQRRIIKM